MKKANLTAAILAAVITLSACGNSNTGRNTENTATTTAAANNGAAADTRNDPESGSGTDNTTPAEDETKKDAEDSIEPEEDLSYLANPMNVTEGDFIIKNSVLVEYRGTDTNIVIPEGVVKIGDEVFSGREDITGVVIPEGVTSIGKRAFYECLSLHNITFPSTLKAIGDSAFWVNTALEDLVLPDGLTTIGDNAFFYCSELVNVEIPKSVTYIGWCAFDKTRWMTRTANQMIKDGELPAIVVNGILINGCYLSGDVVLPEGITAICNQAFDRYRGKDIYPSEPLTSITLPEGLESIGQGAFGRCDSLDKIVIPESVKEIGSNAFYSTAWYKTKLESGSDIIVNDILITPPQNVTDYVFPDTVTSYSDIGEIRKTVESVVIHEGINSLPTFAFADCPALKSVSMSDSIRSIGNYAFNLDPNLVLTKFPSDLTYIGEYAFNGLVMAADITIPESVRRIGAGAFAESGIGTADIPAGVTRILDSTFEASALEKVTIPDTVLYIGNNAFKDCVYLKDVTVPGSVYAIADSAFEGCELDSAVVSEGVLSIGANAFAGCKSISLPASLIFIDDTALNGGQITFAGTQEQWKALAGENLSKLSVTCTG